MKSALMVMSAGAGLAVMLSAGCPPARTFPQGGSGGGTPEMATCSDNAQNGTETDVDCGGDCSSACPNGDKCKKDGDCVDAYCPADTLRCTKPGCADGAKNGAETDVDCGGADPTCQRCKDGQACNIGADCVSTVCTAQKCVPATCTDGMKNGTESAVDCGGTTCPGCPLGKPCGVSGDCDKAVCDTGTCSLAKSCNDLLKANPKLMDGIYSIDIGGMPHDVFCDMTTDGGGWTALINPVMGTLPATLSTLQVTASGGPCGTTPNDNGGAKPNGAYAVERDLACGFTLTLAWQNKIGATDVMFEAVVQGNVSPTLTVNTAPIPSDAQTTQLGEQDCFFWNGPPGQSTPPGAADCTGAYWCVNQYLNAKPHEYKGAIKLNADLSIVMTTGPNDGGPYGCFGKGANIQKLFVR